MCGRVTMLGYDEVRDVVEQVEAGVPLNALPDWPAAAPREDARPGSELCAFRLDGKTGLVVSRLCWGFPVDWQSGLVYNTRIESALEGGSMWDAAIARGRCVVPVARYYEPHRFETSRSAKTGRTVKRPYAFFMPDGAPVLLAGVSDAGYLSIVTTEPNSLMAPVHGRMPLMLRQDEVATWFGPDFARLADRSGFVMRVVPEEPAETGQERLF